MKAHQYKPSDRVGIIKHISYRHDYDKISRTCHSYTVYELWMDGILKVVRTAGQIQKGCNTMPIVNNISQFKKLCKLWVGSVTIEKSHIKLDFQAQK